jgi:hypothetical protein
MKTQHRHAAAIVAALAALLEETPSTEPEHASPLPSEERPRLRRALRRTSNKMRFKP